MSKSMPRHAFQSNPFRRPISRLLLIGGVLALSFGIPILGDPFSLPAAYAHHGGGGGGSGGGGGGGGGKGDGINSTKPTGADRPSPSDGQGKGGRGYEGLKP